jgi:membrane-bound lytic murein transglycosylase B
MMTNSAATSPPTRRPDLGARAARLAGATLLAAATALAGTINVSEREPVADRAVPAPVRVPESGAAPGSPAATPPPLTGMPVSDAGVTDLGFTHSGDVVGVPASVLAAYRSAATTLAITQPGCHLPTELIAAIGKVESGHARGGRVDAAGRTVSPILGPVLSGEHGFAAIHDTDGGRLDGDPVWDRAVGPMQFIPGTWAKWGADGNGDGVADPHNVFDASLAAGRYLCAGGRDLAEQADLEQAVLSYNDSRSYLRLVLGWKLAYTLSLTAIPDGTAESYPPDENSTPDPGEGTDLALPARTPPLAAPAPSTGQEAGPPSTSPPATPPASTPTPPPMPPPGAPQNPPGPVSALLCAVGGLLGGVTGLLGAPQPEEDC